MTAKEKDPKMSISRRALSFTLIVATVATFTALGARAASAGAEDAGSGAAYRAVLEPYEDARAALAEDRLEPAREAGRELHRTLGRIAAGELSAESAGVPADRVAEVRALLPELEPAAEALAGAADLETARDAFYALSKPLVRWRQAAGDGPNVAYCPMAKRSWLQPGEEIENPYYGPAMLDCGSVVGG